MHKKKKHLVSAVLLILCVFVFVWVFNLPATAADSEVEKEIGIIKVVGEAEVSEDPEQVTIVLGIETTDKSAQVAAEENAERTDSVLGALKGIGLDEKNLKTSSYRLDSFKEDISDSRDEDISKYRAVNRLEVISEDIKETGEIIDTAVNAGANSVQSLDFGLKNPQKAKLEALKLAVAQAEAKAEAVAESVGVSITKIKTIHEESSTYSPYRDSSMREAAEVDALSTPIEPGEVEIQARVSIEYKF